MTIDGIRIEFRVDGIGLLIATSLDLRKLHVTGWTFDQVEAELPQAISDLRINWPYGPVKRLPENVDVTKSNRCAQTYDLTWM